MKISVNKKSTQTEILELKSIVTERRNFLEEYKSTHEWAYESTGKSEYTTI
jgi:hypothetical protein